MTQLKPANSPETPEIILQNYLLQNIPISAAMGVKVDLASTQQVILNAPLANNINHKKTAFGGSLHAVATLACWSLLHLNLLKLSEDHFQIVIASSEVAYLAPVISDFTADCRMVDLESLEWNRFVKMFQKKGKGRIKLNAIILQENQLCVEYSGVFVALIE